MKSTHFLILALLLLLNAPWTRADEDPPEPPSHEEQGLVQKVGGALEQGANAAADGIETGVNAATHGAQRGFEAVGNGIQRGMKATTDTIDRISAKIFGTPKAPRHRQEP